MSGQLPEGKTCDDCARFERCVEMFSASRGGTTCDWDPSRFVEAVKREARRAESPIIGIMEQMARGTYKSPLAPPPGDPRAAHQVIPGTRECAPDCACWASRKRLKVVP